MPQCTTAAGPAHQREAGRGSERFPAAHDRRVEVRSSRGTAAVWGSPRFMRWPACATLPPRPPAGPAGAAPPGDAEKRAVGKTGERRSRRPGRERGRRAGGCAQGRARPRRLPGKLSRRCRGWRPGRERPRCSWAGPGERLREPGSQAGTQWPRRGHPFWGGVSAGDGGEAETVKWRGAGRSAREPRGAGAVGLAAPGGLSSLYPVSRGDLGRALEEGGRSRGQLVPIPPSRRWLCPGRGRHHSSRLQCPLVSTPVRAQAAKAELRETGLPWPSEQVQSALKSRNRSELMQVEVRGNTREGSGTWLTAGLPESFSTLY